jgi:hypothetical protein
MKLTRIVRFLPALLLVEAFGAVRTPAGPGTIVLASETQALGDTILLSYLLPKDASQRMRQIAENISLGTSPQPGSTRRISRLSVLTAIEASGLSPASFQVPETVDVHRATRTLTREDVFSAIQSARAANPLQGWPQFSADDLTFSSSIMVPEGGVRLHVTQYTFDPLLGQARFRLWSPAKPVILPFFVTADLRKPRTPLTNASFAPDSNATIVLVDPKRIARLNLHSANSQMTLSVQPLVPGHMDETIPVRLLSNRKTLRARVVGAGSLDASF